jgi:hypothetical protein
MFVIVPRGETNMDDLQGQIRTKREAAARARSVAQEISLVEDRQRVLAFAAELDGQADELERRLRAVPPPQGVTQIQMQQQATKDTDQASDDHKP